MSAPSPSVSVERLTKRFGSVTAVWRVSLEISSGDFWVIFGPNGAGKSTLLRLLAQLSRPSEGEIRFSGKQGLRGLVGYVSHQSLLYGDLTGLENLIFFGKLYELPDPIGRAEEMLDRLGLSRARDWPVRGYSSGMKQRLSLARALLHDPSILLLDEPFAGLDQHGSRLLTEMLAELRREKRTVLMITHNLAEGLTLASHVMVMSRGRAVFTGLRESLDGDGFESLYFRLVEG